MEVLGVTLAALGTVIIVYLVVYTLPRLIMNVVRATKKKRQQPSNPADLEAHETYEIYVSLRAA
jgi:hypothetical protein